MRKGSTSLGSLGVIPRMAGIVVLILPIIAAATGAILSAAPVRADEEAAPITDEAALRDALKRRIHWLAPASRKPANLLSPSIRKIIHTRATWYGPGFHGRRTASGERFDRNAMTLASRHLPFGTRLRVVNPRTGRSAIARVNDRGPFRRGYTADLSQGLARRIGLLSSGPVRLEILH
jgi:rare lipoprotein A